MCFHSHQKRYGSRSRSYIAFLWGRGPGQLLRVEITGDLIPSRRDAYNIVSYLIDFVWGYPIAIIIACEITLIYEGRWIRWTHWEWWYNHKNTAQQSHVHNSYGDVTYAVRCFLPLTIGLFLGYPGQYIDNQNSVLLYFSIGNPLTADGSRTSNSFCAILSYVMIPSILRPRSLPITTKIFNILYQHGNGRFITS